MVKITRKVEFSASHYCAVSTLSDSETESLFGKAARPTGHGHNYVLEVTVTGKIDPISGMIMDLKMLKDLINEQVIDIYDHRFLNKEVPPFDRCVPTPENIAVDIWKRMEKVINSKNHELHQIRLWETPDLYVDYLGPNSEQNFQR